jgi:hypothetical protein
MTYTVKIMDQTGHSEQSFDSPDAMADFVRNHMTTTGQWAHSGGRMFTTPGSVTAEALGTEVTLSDAVVGG